MISESKGERRGESIRKLVPVWLVWESGTSRGHPFLALRGIATTQKRAAIMEGQTKADGFLHSESQSVWTEEAALDHLFGHDDLTKAIEIEARNRARKEREGD